MPACCVSYCNNRTEKGVRIFMLPQGDRNKERRDAWIRNIKRKDLSPRAHVCEVHFDYDQFENNREDGKRILKNSALPTLFNEEHLKKQFNDDNANGIRRSTRKRKPIVFDEYQSGQSENEENSQSSDIKKEIEMPSDNKTTESVKKKEPLTDLIRCRTCLNTTPKEYSHLLKKMLLGKTIKQAILICVPQMELLDNEYVCDKCYKFLLKLMIFIDNCLDTEEQLGTGNISLEVNSKDLADINKGAYQSVVRKKGRPRKYPTYDHDDEDYKPPNILEKIPKKRGRKRKLDIFADAEKEENKEPVGVKWGIPNTGDQKIVVRKYGKPKTSDNQPETNNESPIVLIDSNDEVNTPNDPMITSSDTTESVDETEMFIEHAEQDNSCAGQVDSTSDDSIITKTPLKENQTTEKVFVDNYYVPEYLRHLLRCPLCMTDYRTLRGIKLHLTTAHRIAEEQSFKCSLCNMKFIRYKDMVKHKIVHGHACELCEDFFPTAEELNSHRTVHPEKYCCVKCGAKFQKKLLLEKHLPLHLMMSKIRALIKSMGKTVSQCPHCNLKCGYASALQQHIKAVHLKIKDFECGACHKKFASTSSLKVHVRVRHSKDTPYVCQECGVGYGRLDYLQMHEKIHIDKHNPFVKPAKRIYGKVTNNLDSAFSCIFCSVKTSSKEELLVHLQIHNGIKKYECDYCGLILSCQRSKLSHEETHKTTDVEYVCPTCLKKFPTKEEFQMHKDHLECASNKFTCSICNDTYARQILLETHILNEHVENFDKEEDKDDSSVDIVEVNRRNISNDWSSDEEEEESVKDNSSNEEILKPEYTDPERLNEDQEEEEEYIVGIYEDVSMGRSVENSFQTEKESPNETNEIACHVKFNHEINNQEAAVENNLEMEKEILTEAEEMTCQVTNDEENNEDSGMEAPAENSFETENPNETEHLDTESNKDLDMETTDEPEEMACQVAEKINSIHEELDKEN